MDLLNSSQDVAPNSIANKANLMAHTDLKANHKADIKNSQVQLAQKMEKL